MDPADDLLRGLNPRQREAVEHPGGPVLVLAGAGSGKTRVLTHRVAYLIRRHRVPAGRILAITFTNKAANEMKERLEVLLGGQVRDLWVSTFHAACVRILRRDIPALGYPRSFVIYDEADQQALLRRGLKELNLDEKRYPPRSLAAAIGQLKNQLWTPERAQHEARDLYARQVARVYAWYQEKLKENFALDFDDLIMQTVILFREHPEILRYYQEKFLHILVDEYQDTNHAQYVLVSLLGARHRNVYVVGDPDQSIYRWRGADIRNILEFERDYPEARVILLEQNYRSTQAILEAANALIRQNRERPDKALWTENDYGLPPVGYEALDESDEARFVAREILRLRQEEGRPFSHFAVLYRTHAQSRVLEECFLRLGLPYEVFGGVRFYERKEIKDLLAYLRVLVNPADTVSLERIINVPRRGVGDVTWSRILAEAAAGGRTAWEVLADAGRLEGVSRRVKNNLSRLVEFMEALRAEKDALPVTRLVERLLEDSGYLAELRADATPEGQARLENVEEFLSVALAYDREPEPEKSLEDFLARLSLVTDIDQLREADRVVLLTLHMAKGLEFPVVFLVGLEEGVFPHVRSLGERAELEEERRLCYVGMTRARERLYLTWARVRTLYGYTEAHPVSRFVQEIPPSLIMLEEAVEAEPSPPAADGFRLGEVVEHARWGRGVVVQVSPGQVTVAFPEAGIKHLLLEYAPLRKVEDG
ncbi:MAG: DNA helicase PcrA [Clostridia bacterium]|jgi:DNA helicase-2/ATP-dependent DNA helicase PcrA|nr:DNA helicase PcrA [Clostridia bacterium]MDH7573671.1 DNA helicase PcrA [Clostridia bacterium]